MRSINVMKLHITAAAATGVRLRACVHYYLIDTPQNMADRKTADRILLFPCPLLTSSSSRRNEINSIGVQNAECASHHLGDDKRPRASMGLGISDVRTTQQNNDATNQKMYQDNGCIARISITIGRRRQATQKIVLPVTDYALTTVYTLYIVERNKSHSRRLRRLVFFLSRMCVRCSILLSFV